MIELLVTSPFREALRKRLEECFGDRCHIIYSDTSEKNLAELVQNAEVIIGQPEPEYLKTASKLQWVQMTWAGTERYTNGVEFPKEVVLTNASGAFGGIISEYVVGAILAIYRRFFNYRKQQENQEWKDAGTELGLEGKTALILGTGDLGSNVAKRLSAFEVTCIGMNRTGGREKKPYFDRLIAREELSQTVKEADFVIGCLPNTPETRGLLDSKVLSEMKSEAVLVNVGRGTLIDTEALLAELLNGKFLGVVLDVFEQEPLPKEHPLWREPRVFVTPHISGVSFGHEIKTEEKIMKLCCENLERYLKGEPLRNRVDFATGYREKQEAQDA